MLSKFLEAVTGVLAWVRGEAKKEADAKHEANKAEAEARVKQPGEAEAVLKGKR